MISAQDSAPESSSPVAAQKSSMSPLLGDLAMKWEEEMASVEFGQGIPADSGATARYPETRYTPYFKSPSRKAR